MSAPAGRQAQRLAEIRPTRGSPAVEEFPTISALNARAVRGAAREGDAEFAEAPKRGVASTVRALTRAAG